MRPNKPNNSLQKPSNDAKSALVFAVIGTIVAIIAIVFSGLAWQQMRGLNGGASTKIAQVKHTFAEKLLENKANLKALELKLQRQQQDISHLQAASTPSQRILGQAAYLVHLANLQLRLGYGTNASTHLLESAHQLVQPLHGASLLNLKNVLSHDIKMLKGIPQINVNEIISQLDDINKTVTSLPLLPKHMQRSSSSPTQTKHPFWDKLGGLKDLIIIRHINKPVTPLITPKQQMFLRNNIVSKINQAQWALLHQNPTLYQHSLALAYQWINDYYHDKNATAKTLQELKSLLNINIKPKLPDISNTIEALNSAMATISIHIIPNKTKPKIKPKPKINTPQIKQSPGVEI